ncbi:hypothetical protein L208DRAFT_1315423, partial [Tricholoma matsutake]
EQENQGEHTWAPFEDQAEWDLACWLIKNVGQKSIDEYLKLPIVSLDNLVFRIQTKLYLKIQQHAQLSFHNTYSFLKKIDKLPSGPEWTCDVIDVTGDHEGEDGMLMREQLELWHCDPVECIQDLIGNPAFHDHLADRPEHVYADSRGGNCIIDKTWTAD